MSFKLIVLFASMAAISCNTQFESREQEEFFNNRDQNAALQQLNDERRFQEQDRFEENRQFSDRFDNERRFQDRFNNDNRRQDRFDNERRNQNRFDDSRFNFQQNFNNRGTFDSRVNPQNPTFFQLQPAVFNVQSSSRHFNVQDDSNYDVAYSVSDMTTGDIKSHQETRRGDEVKGQYTIIDSDGFQRRVNYRANDRNGFDAEVKREPIVGFLRFSANQNQQNFNNNQNFGNDFNSNQQLNNQFQNQQHFLAVPKSMATTSVSKTEDGQHNQYTTSTTNN